MPDKDETKGTPKDESGKGTPKKDETKGTPKDKGKLYTQAAIDKLKSDAAAMGQGRAEKVATQEKEALTSELESIKGRFDALEAQARESRLAEARGDAGKMHAFQSEEALAKRERQLGDDRRDLTRQQGLLKTAQDELKESQGTVSVAYTAAKHGLKAEDLEEFSDLSPEALEKLAVKLAAAGKPPETAEEKTAREAREAAGEENLELDSGEGSGSGEPTEQERLDERYPTMAKNK